jgi:hypothetical protein
MSYFIVNREELSRSGDTNVGDIDHAWSRSVRTENNVWFL